MTHAQEAAQHLVSLRRSGQPGARIPEHCRPADSASALAIQREVTALLGLKAGGWKCSAPVAGRIPFAPLYAPLIYRKLPCPAVPHDGMAQVEPEIAFVLRRDLPRRDQPYSDQEIDAAIGETRLVVELIGSRYADSDGVDFIEKLADCISNEGFFIGPVLSIEPQAVPSAFDISIQGPQGEIVAAKGMHPDGHPLTPFRWLANYLAANGEGLKAGEIVTTGSYAGILRAPIGVPLRISFGDLGVLDVEFVKAQ